ncbi:hypothetical protein B7494_g2850 [Chlorociboria aeruginascens]|nr:hypothetical protein B7494_g2850 [Chlorociboria aeruginascens]
MAAFLKKLLGPSEPKPCPSNTKDKHGLHPISPQATKTSHLSSSSSSPQNSPPDTATLDKQMSRDYEEFLEKAKRDEERTRKKQEKLRKNFDMSPWASRM